MKKLFAALLALMLAVLPVLGMAEGSFMEEAAANGRAIESVTTIVPGKELTGQEAVDMILSDALSALKVTYYWQEIDGTQAGVRVALQGTEVLTADMAGKEDEVYVTSDLLAGTTLAMKPDEAEAVTDKLLDLLVRKELMTQAQADEIRAEVKSAVAAAAEEADPTANVDFEKMFDAFLDNDEAINEFGGWLDAFAERVEDVAVTDQPENSDPATSAQRMTMTAEDIISVWEIMVKWMKGNEEYMSWLDQIVEQSGEAESGAALLDKTVEKLRRELPETLKSDVTLTVYLAEGATVAMTTEMVLQNGDIEEPVKLVYTRLTAEDGVATHTFVWDMMKTESGEEEHLIMTAVFTVRDSSCDATFSLSVDDGVLTVAVQANWENGETERKADVALTWTTEGNAAELGNGRVDFTFEEKKTGDVDAEQTIVLKLTQNDKLLFTVINESKTVDPHASIVTDDVLRPADMTDDELDAWFDDVFSNLQVWVIKFMQALPASLLMLFLGVA